MKYVIAFLTTRHHQTKHLLRKQAEIRELRAEVTALEEKLNKYSESMRKIHVAIKENFDGFFWY